jgi:hypothetical protein
VKTNLYKTLIFKMIKNNTIIGVIITLLALVFIGTAFSAGYHYANEIVPGQFQAGNYSFNGSLGIGTGSPSRKGIHINDPLGVESNILFTTSNSGTSGSDGLIIQFDRNQNVNIFNKENGNMTFATNTIPRLIITSDGNIGVGTSNPRRKLHVYDSNHGGGIVIDSETATDSANLRIIGGVNHWNIDNYGGRLRFFTETDYDYGGS